ncbi:hypothetical protein HDU90_006337, partial [Geranomyces variabilis]
GTDLAQDLHEWAMMIANPPKGTIPEVRNSLSAAGSSPASTYSQRTNVGVPAKVSQEECTAWRL